MGAENTNQGQLTRSRTTSWQRWALALAALFGVGFLSLRWYLSSRFAATQVETHLANVLGVPVRIGDIAIGWTESTWLGGLAIHETEDAEAGPPWLTARNTRADVAAMDWFGNGSPREIDLQGASIALRFDSEGKMLTRLPWPDGNHDWPRLVLAGSRIVLEQQGCPIPLSLSGLETQIVWSEPRLILTGSVRDPRLGDWEVDGFLEPETCAMFLHLQTGRTQLDREKLEQLPFVSPRVWQQVRIEEGVTAADLTLRFHLDRPGVHYRLELDVDAAKLEVYSIDLKTEQTSGKVIVEDGHVQLQKIKGQTAGGRIIASGELAIQKTGSRMQFDIEVQQTELGRLPQSWRLPPQISGKLTGQATLQVNTENGPVHTTGTGRGSIDKPLLFGLSFPRPIPIRLTANGSLHFGLDLLPGTTR